MAFQTLSHRAHEAAKSGDVSLLLKLFKFKINTNVIDENGNTALSVAVKHNQTTCAKMLLEYGFNVEDSNNQLHRPLHLATLNGNKEMISLLLEHKAKCGVPNYEGFSPIDLTQPGSKTYKLLLDAKRGIIVNKKEEILDVPFVPLYSIPQTKVTEKSSKGKKGKKKGGKKKKK